MWISRFLDKLRYSEFYLHHSGFGGWIEVTFFDKRRQDAGMSIALSEEATEKLCDIHAGRNGVYIEFSSGDDSTEDRFIALAFEHRHLMRRNRVDLFLSPAADNRHIHAKLTASRLLTGEQGEILFDDDVALFDDSINEPFVMHGPSH